MSIQRYIAGNSKCTTPSNHTSHDNAQNYGSEIQEHDAALNEDCLLLILEELDFESLVNIAQTSKAISLQAANVFKRRFSHQKFAIVNHASSDLPKYIESVRNFIVERLDPLMVADQGEDDDDYGVELHDLIYNADLIKIDKFNAIVNTLRHFGRFIQRLSLDLTNADTKHSQLISRFVSKYCSESLVEIEFLVSSGNAVEYMEKRFENVEHVMFRHHLPLIEERALAMNESFPALRTLSLTLWNKNGGSYLKCHFPHLRHLNVGYGALDNNTFLYDLLEANPQIRHITMSTKSSKFLEDVKLLLPQLEHLTFEDFPSHDDEIRFENVTKLAIKGSRCSPNNKLFPELKDLDFTFHPNTYFHEWLSFFTVHDNLSKLSIEYSNINDMMFERLMAKLQNLEKVVVNRMEGKFIGIDAIVRFIENHKVLTEFRLNACKVSAFPILRERFKAEWNSDIHGSEIIFKRK